MVRFKILFLVVFFALGTALSFFAVTVYQCDNDVVVTTIHEDENGYSWSIIDYNGDEPELVGSGHTSGAYAGSCPQVA